VNRHITAPCALSHTPIVSSLESLRGVLNAIFSADPRRVIDLTAALATNPAMKSTFREGLRQHLYSRLTAKPIRPRSPMTIVAVSATFIPGL